MDKGSIVRISSNFNRFFHSILKDFHSQARANDLTITCYDEFKQNLKSVNEDYPLKDGLFISTRDIENKDLIQHIEFIIKFAGEFGISLQFVEDEWDRILKEAGCA